MPGPDHSARRAPKGLAKTLCWLPLLLAATFSVSAADVMYRFENADGSPVYSYTLPSDQARYGYQKIDPHTGQVLETVAPQLPPAELAAKLRREQALKDCRDDLERIYNLYGSRTDIERALQNALDSLETRIGQLEANLLQAEREQNRLRSQAADAERAGRQIPRQLLENIDRSRSQIETLTGEIEHRRAEQVEASARYARELERFLDGTCPEPGTLAEASPPGR